MGSMIFIVNQLITFFSSFINTNKPNKAKTAELENTFNLAANSISLDLYL